MMTVRAILFVLVALLTVPATAAPQIAQTARERAEILHLIRKEKLDLILPGAMRDNNIDMWIHVVRDGDSGCQRSDFLTFDVGVGYLDYFSTDYKRNAYLLREGETTVPASTQHAYAT